MRKKAKETDREKEVMGEREGGREKERERERFKKKSFRALAGSSREHPLETC